MELGKLFKGRDTQLSIVGFSEHSSSNTSKIVRIFGHFHKVEINVI